MNKIEYPLVTIITPSFNQGLFLEETINSVLNQSYKNIEYIVVDGLSTDNTLEILSKYKSLISNIIIEKDFGQSDALNKGFAASKGDLIGWINSDDLLDSNAIQNVVNVFMSRVDIDFIYGNINLIDESSKHLDDLRGSQVIYPNLLIDMTLPIPQQGSFWRRRVYDSIGGLNIRYHYVLDREYFIKICSRFNSYYLDCVLGKFRMHSNSKSVSLTIGWAEEIPSLYEDLTNNFSPIHSLGVKFKNKILAESYLYTAYLSIKEGMYIDCLKYIIRSIRLNPLAMINTATIKKLINKILKKND